MEANDAILINDGTITIDTDKDALHSENEEDAALGNIYIDGGTIDVSMGSGDTDAFDANGDIYINGGTINVEASSAFDADGTAQLHGGDVTVNGEKITEITQSRQGGGGGRGSKRP
ncbi:carbohydrate-binding domain-containing protein [Paenibacillus sp. sgz500958]|uniref:carbohydrate-binding domain-containing protein n=1 Tax=Paenibacillus sp. sgz500958 TaxID=3242475 RepID=UPI0036D2668D